MDRKKFNKSYWLSKKVDFERLYKSGLKKILDGIVVYNIDNKLSHFRLAVIIKKKLFNACKRNYFKRRIRELFRTNINSNIHKDFLVIFYNDKIDNEKISKLLDVIK